MYLVELASAFLIKRGFAEAPEFLRRKERMQTLYSYFVNLTRAHSAPNISPFLRYFNFFKKLKKGKDNFVFLCVVLCSLSKQ